LEIRAEKRGASTFPRDANTVRGGGRVVPKTKLWGGTKVSMESEGETGKHCGGAGKHVPGAREKGADKAGKKKAHLKVQGMGEGLFQGEAGNFGGRTLQPKNEQRYRRNRSWFRRQSCPQATGPKADGIQKNEKKTARKTHAGNRKVSKVGSPVNGYAKGMHQRRLFGGKRGPTKKTSWKAGRGENEN